MLNVAGLNYPTATLKVTIYKSHFLSDAFVALWRTVSTRCGVVGPPQPSLKLEVHPLLAVVDCLFIMYLHLPSVRRGQSLIVFSLLSYIKNLQIPRRIPTSVINRSDVSAVVNGSVN